jgi:4-oxalocrotonate tautomerase
VPAVTVQALAGRTLEQKRELARRITEATVEVFQVRPENVTVRILEYEPENFAKAGVLYADRPVDQSG